MACFKNNKQIFVWKQLTTKINKITKKKQKKKNRRKTEKKYIKLYHGFHHTDSFYITTISLYTIPE